jgi:RHS repeat-associated protein
VTNQSGAVISRQDYEPFGGELGAVGMRSVDSTYGGGNSVRQKYAGMEQDESSGMAHTLWRKYDSQSGRWTSPDPYGGSMTIADPQSFNRYTYVNNDPVNKVDRTGLRLSDIGIVQTDDPEYAWTLQRNSDMNFQRTVNYDSARRRGLDVKEEPGGFGRHFTIQQQDFQALIPNPKPGEVWFDGYFNDEGMLTWWFHVPYTLTEEFAGTSVDESLPDETPIRQSGITRPELPMHTSTTVCIGLGLQVCGGIIKNSNGKRLYTYGFSYGLPLPVSVTAAIGPDLAQTGLSINGSISSPAFFGFLGGTGSIDIPSGNTSKEVWLGTPQAGGSVMITTPTPVLLGGTPVINPFR